MRFVSVWSWARSPQGAFVELAITAVTQLATHGTGPSGEGAFDIWTHLGSSPAILPDRVSFADPEKSRQTKRTVQACCVYPRHATGFRKSPLLLASFGPAAIRLAVLSMHEQSAPHAATFLQSHKSSSLGMRGWRNMVRPWEKKAIATQITPQYVF